VKNKRAGIKKHSLEKKARTREEARASVSRILRVQLARQLTDAGAKASDDNIPDYEWLPDLVGTLSWSLNESFEAGDKKCIQHLDTIGYAGLGTLLNFAHRGSEDAATKLSERLIQILELFLQTCDKKPELFYPAAEERSIWPGLITLEAQLKARYRHYDPTWARKRVRLGERTGINYEGKLAGNALGSNIARGLFDTIERMRRISLAFKVALPKNPPLVFSKGSKFTDKDNEVLRLWAKSLPVLNRRKDVLAKWWSVMRPFFVKSFGNDFENREMFAHYWTTVKTFSLKPKYAEKLAKDCQRRNEIRRRILKDVRQGLQSIAAKQPAT
jgi:hypothetical protein